ncbi:MAG: tetratricopeptide repeat protein, partial [Nocardioidaceae bacterium]|nr:tetratricopeptide repeat protein [Nocardioidaceae bacterium]
DALGAARRAVATGAWSEAASHLPHLHSDPALAGRIHEALGNHDQALALLDPAAADLVHDDATFAALLRSEAAVRGAPAALARYATHREHLADQLGIDPSPHLQALHRDLLARDRPVRSGLSHYVSSMVGREDDLTRLRALVRSHRVVSILGPGGLGKTRLAHLVAGEAEQPVVHVVELVGVTASADVVAEVGSVLGVRASVHGRAGLTPQQVNDVRSRIAQQLTQAPSLLVLDNCEHVVDAAADLVAFLVAVVPNLTVLTTTRAPLAIAAEHVFELSRLSVEDAADLFCQRAVAARSGVLLPDEAVATVVDRLDGLPLAIELAAAKVRAMGVEDIANRLVDRFALLRGGDRSAPDRHQTLLAVIDWSWNLLDEEQRRGLRWLSIFHDGMTLAGAEALLGGDALHLVSELVDQSLLTVFDGATGGPVRYRMLETVREFGRMQLSGAGEEGPALAAHRAWAVGFVDEVGPGLFGSDQIATIDALGAEENNLADALRKALSDGDTDAVVTLVATLGGFWSIRGEHARVITLVEAFAAVLTQRPPSPARADEARSSLALTIINAWIAQPAVLEDLRDLLSRLGPGTSSTTIAAITTVVLAVSTTDNDWSDAERLAQSTEPAVRSIALQALSHVRENEGDLAGAVEASEHALAGATVDHGPWIRAMIHAQLAGLYSQLGRFDEARPHAEEAVPILLRLGARDDALQAMAVTAIGHLEAGDPAAAERVLEETVALSGTHAPGADGALLTTRAEIAFARGEDAEGCRLMRAAADMMSAIRFPGMGPDADLAPWTIYGRSVACIAFALHADPGEGDDLHDAMVAVAPRLVDRGRSFPDIPVIGLLLLTLGVWGLRRGSLPRTDAVRLLALAHRCSYPRYTPSLAWPPILAMAETAAPGLFAEIDREYNGRRGPVLVGEAREVLAALTRR